MQSQLKGKKQEKNKKIKKSSMRVSPVQLESLSSDLAAETCL